MTNSLHLKIGDKIRITSVPCQEPGDYIHPDTVSVYKKLIKRNRSVRISEIDSDGTPWYTCKLKNKKGKYELHFLSVYEFDNNWTLVKPRK